MICRSDANIEKGTEMGQQAARCPACGGYNLHVAEWYDADGGSSYYMVCDDCGYEDPDKFEEEYVAVDHWNRRVVKGYIDGDDPTDTEYDQLDECDWCVMPERPVEKKDYISWTASDHKYGSSACSYREPKQKRCEQENGDKGE